MVRIAWVCVLLLLGVVDALAQPARAPSPGDRRVALVIGNATYKDAPLRNPVNDARAMAGALQNLGFEVIKRENASQKDMNRAIGEFTTRLAQGGTGLFYYAGHGMQVKGRNYLLPVDAEISSELSVRSEAVDVDTVLDGMASAANPLNMVILDACRNNPFERRFRGAAGGLAQVDAPKGALIAYATAPGKVAADGDGANGLYTAELLRAITEPNLRVEDVFKRVRARVASVTNDLQVPWEASSLVGDFYFKQQKDDTQVELAFWQSVQNSADPQDFQGYLDQFPNGRFATLARNRLRTLQGNQAQAQQVQAQQAQAQQAQQQRQAEVAREAEMRAEAQRQAEAQRVEQQRQAEAQRQAALAEQQRAAQADEARRRAEAERLAAMEAEVKRLTALTEQQRLAAQAPAPVVAPRPASEPVQLGSAPSPAPPPAEPVPLGSPSPAAAPQTAMSAPSRASLDGSWSGRAGGWIVELGVKGGDVDGKLTCGNTIYRLRERLDEHSNVSGSATRIIGSSPFPTQISVRGSFPGIAVNATGAPGGCGNGGRATLARSGGG